MGWKMVDDSAKLEKAKAILDKRITESGTDTAPTQIWPYIKKDCGCASCTVKRVLIELRAEMFGEEQTDDTTG